MKFDWPEPRCVLCLHDDVPMTRAHVVPKAIGGFLWGYTLCQQCNSWVGSTIEAFIKTDDGIRIAVEKALANQLPASFVEAYSAGQPYMKQIEGGRVRAVRAGEGFTIRSSVSDDGSLIQATSTARESVRTMLAREGRTVAEIEEAIARLESAPLAKRTRISDTIEIRHGVVEDFDQEFGGASLTNAFPAMIAFQMLALLLGRTIYDDSLNELRAAIRRGDAASEWHKVEAGRTRSYAPWHLVGVAQTEPHVVVRVLLFDFFVWRVHFPLISVPEIEPQGILLDLKQREAFSVEPKPRNEPLAVP